MYKNGKNIIIIDHNVNCVDSILRDIRKTHPLTTEEEQQLWLQMQQGSQNIEIFGLLDFAKGEDTTLDQYDWKRRNITSREMTYKDKGKNSKFRTIRAQNHPEDK